MTPAKAKRILKQRGWSYRRAGAPLGVNWNHLAKVLSGSRQSKALLKRIAEIKQYEPTEASR